MHPVSSFVHTEVNTAVSHARLPVSASLRSTPAHHYALDEAISLSRSVSHGVSHRPADKATSYLEGMGHFVVSLTHELKHRGKSWKKSSVPLEIRNIYAEERSAKPIEHEIQAWKSLLPKASQSKIDPKVWAALRTTLHNTDTFSAFLVTLRHGFLFELKRPSFSFSKGLHSKSKSEFALNRLLPVLLKMQESPALAERLCSMAEDGLGNCRDRPSLTFVDIELEVACETALTHVKHLLAAEHTPAQFNEACQRLVFLEAQKLQKNELVSLLADSFKTVKDGDLDPKQNVLVSYDKIAKATERLPRLPYVTCVSFVEAEVQRKIRKDARFYLTKTTCFWLPRRLNAQLMCSDNWVKLLTLKYPELSGQLQDVETKRLRASEALMNDAQQFDGRYATQLNALNAEHMQARSALLNTVPIARFTREQVAQYVAQQAG